MTSCGFFFFLSVGSDGVTGLFGCQLCKQGDTTGQTFIWVSGQSNWVSLQSDCMNDCYGAPLCAVEFCVSSFCTSHWPSPSHLLCTHSTLRRGSCSHRSRGRTERPARVNVLWKKEVPLIIVGVQSNLVRQTAV